LSQLAAPYVFLLGFEMAQPGTHQGACSFRPAGTRAARRE
jgi:hypothetical protein